MGVLGIGGVVIKSKDAEASKAWYRDRLGMEMNDWGGFDFLHQHSHEKFGDGARSIFSPFGQNHEYFEPSRHEIMVNLMVDNLDEILERLQAHGDSLIGEPMSESNGRFAWVMDPDGIKIELWEPVKA
jgi:catechol 2,3-dioxygenase-like lactoylglutathione lyase family enzyme